MRVLLINPPFTGSYNVCPPLGLGYVGSALSKEGFSTAVLDCALGICDLQTVLRFVRPDWVGITGMTAQYNSMKDLAKISKDFGAKVVFGGIHSSALPEFVIQDCPDVDYVIKGEGEIAFPNLVKGIIGPGIFYRGKDKVEGSNPEYITDLDTLVSPWCTLDTFRYKDTKVHGISVRKGPAISVISSRGCPYSCSFCGASQVQGKKLRLRSSKNFLDELDFLRSQGVKEIQILDDNFTFNEDHASTICQGMLDRGLKLAWTLPNGIRADRVTPKLLKLMKEAGCYYFGLGIESGSQRVLNTINKSLDLNRVKQTVELSEKLGFIVQGFFMVGFPKETQSDLDLTRRVALSLPLDRMSINPVIPMPGSSLYQEYINSGLVIPNNQDWSRFNRLDYRSSNPNYTSGFVRSLNLRFYLNPSRLLKLVSKVRSLSEVKGLFFGSRILLNSVRGK